MGGGFTHSRTGEGGADSPQARANVLSGWTGTPACDSTPLVDGHLECAVTKKTEPLPGSYPSVSQQIPTYGPPGNHAFHKRSATSPQCSKLQENAASSSEPHRRQHSR